MLAAGFADARGALATVRKGWWKIVVATVLVTAAHIVFLFHADHRYIARAAIAIPAQFSPDKALTAAIGLREDLDLNGARIFVVLRSNSLIDATIKQFDLQSRFKASTLELTRESVLAACPPELDIDQRIVFVRCEVSDPILARDMTQFMAEYGNVLYQRISHSIASEERAFLEERLASARAELDEATKALRAFEQQQGVLDLPQQTRAIVSALSRLEGLRITTQLQLAYRKAFASANESTSHQLSAQLATADAQIRSLEESGTGSSDEPSFLLPASAIPRIAFELHDLSVRQLGKAAVYQFLLQRHELAKISEARDTAAYAVLDPATLPTRPSWPNPVVVIACGIFVGVIVGFGWCVLPSWWRRQPWFFLRRSTT